MRQLSALSNVEFEALCGDVLRAETGMRYERFGVGVDGGIDLRHRDDAHGVVEIVQCKQYSRSTFAQLNAAARKEPAKLEKLEPRPTTYRFVTTQSLTPGQKDKLMEALGVWLTDPDLIWGAEEFEDLLDNHSEVEQRHVKLWLSSSTQLRRLLNAGTLNRSNDLIERIELTLPRYVQTQRFGDGQTRLREHGVCLIAGEPGIGKTTLAQMLLLDCAQQGFDPLQVSEDVNEAWEVVDDRPQAFYYDDFLGRVGLSDLSKNEDQRLADLVARAHRDPARTRLILTTREYILRGAVQLSEVLRRADIEHERFLLALNDYSRLERGQVLYNHLWHSKTIKPAWMKQIIESRAYLSIIDHPNYSPRLIEHITGLASRNALRDVGDDWVTFALSALDRPHELWTKAFFEDLDDLQRAAVVCTVSFGRRINVKFLRVAVETYSAAAALDLTDRAFEASLRMLEGTFLRFSADDEEPTADVANPSVNDYVLDLLSSDSALLSRLIAGAAYFEQIVQLAESVNRKNDSDQRERLRVLLEQLIGPLIEAVYRCVDAPPAFPNISNWWPRHSLSGDPDRRLTAAIGIAQEIDPTGLHGFGAWLGARLRSRVAAWHDFMFNRQAAVALYQRLKASPWEQLAKQIGVGEQLRDLLSDLADADPDVDDYDNLDALWRTDPSLFSPEQRANLADDFEIYARERLESGDANMQEIDRIDAVASSYGAVILDDELHEARANIPESDLDEIDQDRAARYEPEEEVGTDENLDALFRSLGEPADHELGPD